MSTSTIDKLQICVKDDSNQSLLHKDNFLAALSTAVQEQVLPVNDTPNSLRYALSEKQMHNELSILFVNVPDMIVL